MKRLFSALLCAAALLPATSVAQYTPRPTPTPPNDPYVYDDLGMRLEMSKAYGLVAYRPIPPEDLPDHLQPILAYARIKPYAVTVNVSEESFPGKPDSAAYEVSFENELRGAIDGAIVRKKTRITLDNGYPAILVDIVAGDGFNAAKIYAIVWADGLRGVVVQVSGRIGELDEKTARTAFTKMNAVVFPVGRLEKPPR